MSAKWLILLFILCFVGVVYYQQSIKTVNKESVQSSSTKPLTEITFGKYNKDFPTTTSVASVSSTEETSMPTPSQNTSNPEIESVKKTLEKWSTNLTGKLANVFTSDISDAPSSKDAQSFKETSQNSTTSNDQKINTIPQVPEPAPAPTPTPAPSNSLGSVVNTQGCRISSEQEIGNLFVQWNYTIGKKDVFRVLDLYASRSVILPTRSVAPLETLVEKKSYLQEYINTSPDADVAKSFVSIGCNTAVHSGVFTLTTTQGTSKVKFTFVYQWSGTQWLITSQQTSLI
ncbi:MAG: hypothetical protein QM526_01615 [Alphaproteobacteria bacterium]|nr:hypothetical protein [Alphaproteobacteria bacterium]